MTLDGSFFLCFPSQGSAFDEVSPNGLVLPDIFTDQAVFQSEARFLSVQKNSEGRNLEDCNRPSTLLHLAAGRGCMIGFTDLVDGYY